MKQLIKLMMVCLVGLLLLTGSATAGLHQWTTFELKAGLSKHFSLYSGFEARSFEGTYYQHWHNAIDYGINKHWKIGVAFRYMEFPQKGTTEYRSMLNLSWKSDKIGKGFYISNRVRFTRRIHDGDDLWQLRDKVTVLYDIFFVSWEGFLLEGKGSLYRERHSIGAHFGMLTLFLLNERTVDVYKQVLGVTFTVKL